MNRVRDYLSRHHAGECSTRSLAEHFGMTSSTLCRRYREAFGSTIGRDVRRLRIRRACELLRDDPDALVKEVAAAVGYAHATYRTFLNAFRAEVGMTPRQFADRLHMRRLASQLRVVAQAADATTATSTPPQSRIRSA